ncbi:hypothetical protein [Sphaerothrix gracilis]|uniref:hypothetical protein n=1 Tax=Sphaerothrix gracilis TaxID=3151835 RepID=UPI0031FCA701
MGFISLQPAAAQRLEPEDFFEVRTDGLMSDPAGEELSVVRTLQAVINGDFSSSVRSLQSRARALAQTMVSEAFADNSVTDLSVTIVAERNGQQMPVLAVRVNRAQWQQQPSINQWVRLFEEPASVLLGYVPQAETTTAATTSRSRAGRSLNNNSSLPAATSATGSRPSSGTAVVPGASIEESEYYQGDLRDEDLFEYR